MSVARSKTWEILDTTLGQDQFLVGPSPSDPDKEALALFPPGAKVLTAPDAEHPVCADGWRVVLWRADEQGRCYTDVGRPVYVQPAPLSHVIGLVEAECPEQLTWVADRLMLPLVNACAALHAHRTSGRVTLAAKWQRNAEFMLHELDIALTRLPADGLGAAAESGHACTLSDGLPEESAEAWLPQDPGRWDPRLREGEMRAIYEELLADAEATVRHRSFDDLD